MEKAKHFKLMDCKLSNKYKKEFFREYKISKSKLYKNTACIKIIIIP